MFRWPTSSALWPVVPMRLSDAPALDHHPAREFRPEGIVLDGTAIAQGGTAGYVRANMVPGDDVVIGPGPSDPDAGELISTDHVSFEGVVDAVAIAADQVRGRAAVDLDSGIVGQCSRCGVVGANRVACHGVVSRTCPADLDAVAHVA